MFLVYSEKEIEIKGKVHQLPYSSGNPLLECEEDLMPGYKALQSKAKMPEANLDKEDFLRLDHLINTYNQTTQTQEYKKLYALRDHSPVLVSPSMKKLWENSPLTPGDPNVSKTKSKQNARAKKVAKVCADIANRLKEADTL